MYECFSRKVLVLLVRCACNCCAIKWNGLYLPKTANASKTFAHLFMRRIELHINANACNPFSFGRRL